MAMRNICWTHDKFVEMIDESMPQNVKDKIVQELAMMFDGHSYEDISPHFDGIAELMAFNEKTRNTQIKNQISSTHKWVLARISDAYGFVQDIFLCQECDIKASVFQNIKTLSAISKVTDKLPTYTVHNEYLMYTCKEIQNIAKLSEDCEKCMDCGISSLCKTQKCDMIVMG